MQLHALDSAVPPAGCSSLSSSRPGSACCLARISSSVLSGVPRRDFGTQHTSSRLTTRSSCYRTYPPVWFSLRPLNLVRTSYPLRQQQKHLAFL
eukprot:1358091-Rhodomonas_salina.1